MKVVLKQEKCYICGRITDFTIHQGAVLFREARCIFCGSSIRNSDVAEAVLSHFMDDADTVGSITSALPYLAGFRILNTCSSGPIHECLKYLPGYIASEFFDDTQNGHYKQGVLCADLMNLPFDDNSFDLIISEDVFEHISDFKKAFSEVQRVLTAGGYHIFTVPLHEGRITRSRINNIHKVYHGDPLRKAGVLVYTDFGDDLPEILNKQGMRVEIRRQHIFYLPKEITNVDNSFSDYLIKRNRMDEYFKYNSIVLVSQKSSDYTAQRYPSDALIARFIKNYAIALFDANNSFFTPLGCYEIEGVGGNRYTWASPSIHIFLKWITENTTVHIRGHINMDLYKLVNIDSLRLYFCLSGEPIKVMRFSDSTDFLVDLPINHNADLMCYDLWIYASHSVCPSKENVGNDDRNLSWILYSITQD